MCVVCLHDFAMLSVLMTQSRTAEPGLCGRTLATAGGCRDPEEARVLWKVW